MSQWCPCVIEEVLDGSNIVKKRAFHKPGEAVMFHFDATEEQGEEEHTWKVELKPSLWNPKKDHSHGCWRMDVSEYLTSRN